MNKKIFIFLTFLFGLMNQSWANGRELLSECTKATIGYEDENIRRSQSRTDALDVGTCLGMMQGVTQLNAMYQYKLGKDAIFCLPKGGLPNGKAAELVVRYLNAHREDLDEHAIVLIYRALKEEYPCN